MRDRGIPTAELIRFDDTRAVADVAYIVLERLWGRTIDDMPEAAATGARTYASLSEILIGLHSLRTDGERPILGVERSEFSCRELLAELAAAGEIGDRQATWLQEWFDHLEDQGARSTASVLLHGDVMPSNLIVDDHGDVTAIIDWGSACWGEPARDLAGFRPSTLPMMLHSYRTAWRAHATGSPDVGAAVEAGVHWYQLFFALARLLGRRSTSEGRNWSAPRAARLLELVRFGAAGIPSR